MTTPRDPTRFTRESAERIANVVRAAELTPRRTRPIVFDRAHESPRKTFRVATFTGPWPIGTDKEVTFKYVTEPPNTALATNLFCGLSPSGECDVSIAKEGTSWFLLQPNLTQLPGYSGSGTHVLTVVNGNLRFIGTTACASV